MFNGQECRERIDLEPSAQNIRYAVNRRGEVLSKIERGTFNYADEFPKSKLAKRFGFVPSDRTLKDIFDAREAIWGGVGDARGNIEASTWKGYKKVIDRHLIPWWGKTRARDLTPAEIRERILSVPGICLKTARNILTPLSIVLNELVNDDVITANPLDRVKLSALWPKDRVDTDWKVDPFSFEEMVALFGACRDEEEADHWRYAFGSGFRTSEQIALPWSFCDRVARAVRIEVAEVLGLDGAVQKGPKTEAGRRLLPLTWGAWEALERQHGRTGGDGGRVWRDARYNAPWRGDQPLRRRFERICRAAEVRYRNPYQTRHTFASNLLAAGHPAIKVARWMGHEGTEMLERHYGRWIEQGENPATRAALDRFFSHASPTPAEIIRIAR